MPEAGQRESTSLGELSAAEDSQGGCGHTPLWNGNQPISAAGISASDMGGRVVLAADKTQLRCDSGND